MTVKFRTTQLSWAVIFMTVLPAPGRSVPFGYSHHPKPFMSCPGRQRSAAAATRPGPERFTYPIAWLRAHSHDRA